MVSKVFPAEDLADRTLEVARRIARVPTMAALLIKQSVNQTMDNQGFTNALQACFHLHQLNHSHWASLTEGPQKRWVATPDDGALDWRTAPPVQVADPHVVGGVAAGD